MAMLALPSAGEDRSRHLSATRVGALVYALALGMIEAALVGAYLSVRHSSPHFTPASYDENNYLATVSTLAILLSAVGIEWFVWAVRHHERRQATYAAGLTGLFGLAFLNGVTYLLRQSHVSPASSSFGALFWGFFIFNAVAVGLGVAGVLVALLRVQGLQTTAAEPETARAAAWIWQTGVVCWLITWFYVFFLFKN